MITLERKELTKIKNYMFESFSNIQSIDDNKWKNFNKNLLWYTFIESIGHISYSNIKSPGERFKRTLRELCQWEHTDKIISPLFYIFLIHNHPCLVELIKDLEEFCWGDVLRNPGATIRVVQAHQLYTDEEIIRKSQLDKKIIDQFKLENILWQIRNIGIHARWHGDFPTYYYDNFCFACDIKKVNNTKIWRIYTPELFLQNLVKNAIENFDVSEPVEINGQNDLSNMLYQNFLIG